MSVDDKTLEKKLLLKRVYPPTDIYQIGKENAISFFDQYVNAWEPDPDEAAMELATALSDSQLQEAFKKHPARNYVVFRGSNYTFENETLTLKGATQKIHTGITETEKKYGQAATTILKLMAQTGGDFGAKEQKEAAKLKIDTYEVLEKLEKLKVVTHSYAGEEYHEWKMLEETLPTIREELGIAVAERKPTAPPTASTSPTTATANASPRQQEEAPLDPLEDERRRIATMQNELDQYISDLLKNRLNETIKFGKTFSASYVANYLQRMFGEMLYFDSFLSIIQQYSLCDVDIVNPQGKTGLKTGWSFALFGEPGTGKSFSTRDLILGVPGGKVAAHGIPGRNRYCGGITPARFIRIGQAYVGKTFNFIVPEFNDWFRYSGMVDVLKIAMERGEIKHELHREIIGPYRFGGFFTVNYNTAVMGQGYAVTIGDPNFNAIEDRMICRLHRMTKERYVQIAQSQMRLALGEVNVDKSAKQIRDHVTLVYAIETDHPLVKGRFPKKPVMITAEMYDAIGKAREAILKRIPGSMKFSARLEHNVVKFACAASVLNYFNDNLDHIPVSTDALERAVSLYVEEAAVRSKEAFKPEEVLRDLQGKKRKNSKA
ncbi:MAG: hypothetical protein NWF05_11630 [Candidatus Bathyarchaeota archaeon]|nr:hypothetical protein [Candidatus Bathyarchaeota archaeon]